jgi:uncharacterized circularly permuted ATP-grasp superfamily protein/uncharacterized alpha-E superfamily protein
MEHIDRVLGKFSPPEITRLSRAAQELLRDQGLVAIQDGRKENAASFDLLPVAIGIEEWAGIETGLSQRLRAWNAFLHDIHSGQEILKAGVVPYEIIYQDPHYHRECVGLRVSQDAYIHVAACDLIRGPGDRWWVLEDHLCNPTGASYAMQHRRVLSQIFPELMAGLPVAPVYDFPTRLLETLQAAAPIAASAARVVSLSPGMHHEAYFDHVSLARQMGIPLVQGSDLVVLDGELFLKTIGGLERVDVLYRRLEGREIDPVCFRPDSRHGIAGIVSCVRKGTISIANALGSALGDNRALAAYLPAMTEFYLSQQALLPTVPVLEMRDVDCREDAFDSRQKYLFKLVSERGSDTAWDGAKLDEPAWQILRERILKAPFEFVAQRHLPPGLCPVVGPNGERSFQPFTIRVFMLNGSPVHVSPAVWARVSDPASTPAGKDAWVLRSHDKRPEPPALVMRQPTRRMRVGSRTAEAVYWIGRYAERMEATVRILRVVQQLRTEDSPLADPKAWTPLWEALAYATGHPTRFFTKATFQRTGEHALAHYILLDETNASSVMVCARLCRQNAQQVREAIPPEFWTVVNRLYMRLAFLAENSAAEHIRDLVTELSLHDELIETLDELSGASDKHMLHNDVRHFWNLGRHLERGIFTLQTMRQVFLKRTDDTVAGMAVQDDINLDALLRMLAGQYAYRSSYRSRPVAAQVAKLLMQDADFPRSLLFCLKSQQYALQRMFGDRPPPLAEMPLRHISHLVSELSFADMGQYFRPVEEPETRLLSPSSITPPRRSRMRAFSDMLQATYDRLSTFHSLISDHFFSHQAGAPDLAEH